MSEEKMKPQPANLRDILEIFGQVVETEVTEMDENGKVIVQPVLRVKMSDEGKARWKEFTEGKPICAADIESLKLPQGSQSSPRRAPS